MLNNIIEFFKCQHAELEDIADAGACYPVTTYGGNMDNETLMMMKSEFNFIIMEIGRFSKSKQS